MVTEYVALDAHKRYSLLERENMVDRTSCQVRIEHEKGNIAAALQGVTAGTSVALEAVGNWYWIVDEIERVGLTPRLVHPRKAKLMMGMINKKIDPNKWMQVDVLSKVTTYWDNTVEEAQKFLEDNFLYKGNLKADIEKATKKK